MRKESINSIYKASAIQYGIEEVKKRIRRAELEGCSNCVVWFYSFPCDTYREFIEKYGEENKKEFREYNIETELREYFTRCGFTFERVTDDVWCGVKQAPYWIICW